jgi:hypothetical protein
MLKAQLAAVTAVLDINLKFLRRRRDGRPVAANITKARDFVQAYQGPPHRLVQHTCDLLEKLTSTDGVVRASDDRPRHRSAVGSCPSLLIHSALSTRFNRACGHSIKHERRNRMATVGGELSGR